MEGMQQLLVPVANTIKAVGENGSRIAPQERRRSFTFSQRLSYLKGNLNHKEQIKEYEKRRRERGLDKIITREEMKSAKKRRSMFITPSAASRGSQSEEKSLKQLYKDISFDDVLGSLKATRLRLSTFKKRKGEKERQKGLNYRFKNMQERSPKSVSSVNSEERIQGYHPLPKRGKKNKKKSNSMTDMMSLIRISKKRKQEAVDKFIQQEFKRCFKASKNRMSNKSLMRIKANHAQKRRKLTVSRSMSQNMIDIKKYEKVFRDVYVLKEHRARRQMVQVFNKTTNLFKLKQRKKVFNQSKEKQLAKEEKKKLEILKEEIIKIYKEDKMAKKSLEKLSKEAQDFVRNTGNLSQIGGNICVGSEQDKLQMMLENSLKQDMKRYAEFKRVTNEVLEKMEKMHMESNIDINALNMRTAVAMMQGKQVPQLHTEISRLLEDNDTKAVDIIHKTRYLGKSFRNLNGSIKKTKQYVQKRDFKRANISTTPAKNLVYFVKTSQPEEADEILNQYPSLKEYQDSVSACFFTFSIKN